MKAMMVAAFFALCIGQAWAVDTPRITVMGEATVNVVPDRILVSLGIETSDMDIMLAKQKNNAILKKSLVAIKEMGIPEKEVQTDHLSIEPRHDGNDREDNFIGYFVRNSFVVTLDKADKLDDLITKALLTGVNHVHGVEFQTSNLKKYREQAREIALKAAKEKAEKMAAIFGQSIGTPLYINSQYSDSPRYISYWGDRYPKYPTQSSIQAISNVSSESSDMVSLGKIAILARVEVAFELKQ